MIRTFRSNQFGTPNAGQRSLGIPAAAFPGRIATNSDLIVAVDRQQTSLLLPMAVTDTSMTVLNAAGIVAYNLLSIDNEIVKTTGPPAGNVVPVSRGFDGTVAAAHSAGALVSGFIDAYHHNALVAEVEAIETALGPNLSQIGNISNNRFFNAAQFNFPAQCPSGALTGGIVNTITLAPVPLGVNGTNANYYVKITGGGHSELVKVQGGTAVSGAPSGTLFFTPVNSYSTGWCVSSESCGIREAIGYGAICIFFPAGCKWVPADNTIPGGIYLVGESWGNIAGGGSMIEAVNPATQDISVGPATQIYNVNIHGQWCSNFVDPNGVDKWNPVNSFVNTDDVNPWVVQTYPYSTYYGAAPSGQGAQHGADRTCNIAETRGSGSAWYGATIAGANGSCFDAENVGTGSINYRALMGGAHTSGFWASDETDPGTGACFVTDCSKRTGGELLLLNHQGPLFNGQVISSNICYNGGTFNGLFWNFQVQTKSKSTMDANGNVWFGRLSYYMNFADLGSAGGSTIPYYEMTGIVQHTVNTPTTDTTDTAVNITSGIPNAAVGTTFDFYLRNPGSAVLTLVGGAGVTINGTATVPAGQQRSFKVSITQLSPPAVTIFSMGVSTF